MVDMEKFKEVTAMTYPKQGTFFLNAFWAEHGEKAELVWDYCQRFIDLDQQKGKEGCDLDEFSAHRFLEKVGETRSVVELRDTLREVDMDFNKRMALIEYLLFSFQESISELLSRPQGTNEELAKAQKALQEVQDEIDHIEKQKEELRKKADGSGVGAIRAKNELEQLVTSDPTELNRRLVTAGAAVRKAQKLGGDSAQGELWWIDRELEEAKKYKPKGGLKHSF
eukprot:gb/GECH01011576.1/.p1 GENE.gb/GECH01011576.1/~~gb/GECH01011576.1/.p1  ORF type:complete len:225 (+),score=78.32 gb/GECH01011576.1/:1-675(+)